METYRQLRWQHLGAEYLLRDSEFLQQSFLRANVLTRLQVTHNNEYVTYLNKDAAVREGLVQNRNGQLYVGVDSWSHLDPNGPGRKSVRMRSNKSYNSGTLIIGDFAHMPANVCGTWPGMLTFMSSNKSDCADMIPQLSGL